VALLAQLVPQGEVVLDDAVVDDHHVAVAVAMGVGVRVAGLAVSRPARVPDPYRALGKAAFETVGEALELAERLDDAGGSLAVDDGDAGAVITPIFQPPEPVQ
jgi:hypothetical protein